MSKKPKKRASDTALRDYREIKEGFEKAMRPFIKIKIYKPIDVKVEDFKALETDPEFVGAVEKLTSRYVKDKRTGKG